MKMHASKILEKKSTKRIEKQNSEKRSTKTLYSCEINNAYNGLTTIFTFNRIAMLRIATKMRKREKERRKKRHNSKIEKPTKEMWKMNGRCSAMSETDNARADRERENKIIDVAISERDEIFNDDEVSRKKIKLTSKKREQQQKQQHK